MDTFYFIYFLVVAFSLLTLVSGWVFTDINYDHLLRIHGEGIEENDIHNPSDNDMTKLKFSLIYPGTKWCGPGNVADSYDDLGSEWETDSCCREHDNCPDIIPAGETRHNLTNHAFYTRLSCDCDETFRKCLHNANGTVAEQIGTIYFNALGTQCFRDDFPIKGCKKRGGWFNKKCLQYSYNKDGEKKTQWFDVPNY